MRVERLVVKTDDRGELPRLRLEPHRLVEIIVLPDETDDLRVVAEENLGFWDNEHDECWDRL